MVKFIIPIDPAELVPNNQYRKYYSLSILIILGMVGATALLWRSLPRVVPLFFTKPWGEARLAEKPLLLLLPSLGFLIVVVNLILGRMSRNMTKLLAYTAAGATLLINLMLAIAIFGIIQSVL
ncbi:MAG: hypothetical protein UY18_C0015G0002 [Microgenomates group bacterium GW2011_GWF2_47_9]|nr:MAG: hypothetical protein UY18_C0015G0002 [Microgenomates group bacterium GW2011_GWF2_47_9]